MSDQRTEEWFAKRAGKFTGSRFGKLMAKIRDGSPAAGRQELIITLGIERALGTCVETYQNEAMRRGIELEGEARGAYEAHIGRLVEEVDFIDHATVPMVGISPDGLVGDDGMVELKCPASVAKHYEYVMSGSHATEYKWQIQGQLWVAERAWCDAVSYDPRFPERYRLAVTRVYRDEKAIAELEAACKAAEAEVSRVAASLTEQRKAA